MFALIPILMRSKDSCVEIPRNIGKTIVVQDDYLKLLMRLVIGKKPNLVGRGNEGMEILRESFRKL